MCFYVYPSSLRGMWWSSESLTQQIDHEESRKPSNMFWLRVHVKMNLWQAFCFAFCPVWTWSSVLICGSCSKKRDGWRCHFQLGNSSVICEGCFCLPQGVRVVLVWKMLASISKIIYIYIYIFFFMQILYLMLFHPYLGQTVQYMDPFRYINYAAALCWLFMNGWPDMEISIFFRCNFSTHHMVGWWIIDFLQYTYKIHYCTHMLHTHARSPFQANIAHFQML